MKKNQSLTLLGVRGYLLLAILLALINIPQTLQAQHNITKANVNGPFGVKVNTHNGSLFYQRTDIYIPGKLPLEISFSYNSTKNN